MGGIVPRLPRDQRVGLSFLNGSRGASARRSSEQLEQLALHRGHPRIGMGVNDGNERAAALYLRLGYRDIGYRYLDRYHYVDDSGARHEVADPCRFLRKEIGWSEDPVQ